MKYFLYRHIRVSDGTPLYIGIGTKPKRFKSYQYEYSRAFVKSNRSSFWKKSVAKHGYTVQILLESDDRSFIEQKEIEFIKLYGRVDLGTGTLVNLTDGGEGATKQSKLSQNQRIEKIAKPVYQYSFSGEFLAGYSSVKEASVTNRIQSTTIAAVARGTLSSAGNFQWRYTKDDSIGSYEIKYHTPLKVYQYSIAGDFIKEWENANSCKDYFKVNKCSINRACSNPEKFTCKKYRFSYLKQDSLGSLYRKERANE